MREADIFNAFVKKWLVSAGSVEEASLLSAEADLGFSLPGAYRRFLTQHGTPFCPKLLTAIVEANVELHDLQEFIAVGELAGATAASESAGMEPGFLGFAMDCGGNMFLFKKADCQEGAQDPAVWFFDHDFDEIVEEAPSFTEWLKRFTAIVAPSWA